MDTLKALLELGWPAIVLVGYSWLAREYIRSRDAEVQYLRQEVAFLQSLVDQNRLELDKLRSLVQTSRQTQ